MSYTDLPKYIEKLRKAKNRLDILMEEFSKKKNKNKSIYIEIMEDLKEKINSYKTNIKEITKITEITKISKNETDTEVLSLCKIPNSLNIDMLRNSITQYMNSRETYYRNKNRSPFIEDEFSEYYTAEATNGIEIGGGSCGMDVKTGSSEGIDTMCVIMNKSHSNEKSLIQNFSSSGDNLDNLFKEKKDDEALKLFVDEYYKKLENVKKDKNLTDLFIIAFISTDKDVYIVCFKINLHNIKHVKSGGFVNKQKDLCVNIIVSNFINSTYGNVKLYKSKKRMELRLLPSVLKSEYAIKIWSMS